MCLFEGTLFGLTEGNKRDHLGWGFPHLEIPPTHQRAHPLSGPLQWGCNKLNFALIPGEVCWEAWLLQRLTRRVDVLASQLHLLLRPLEDSAVGEEVLLLQR